MLGDVGSQFLAMEEVIIREEREAEKEKRKRRVKIHFYPYF
jgi:hypothetical protein